MDEIPATPYLQFYDGGVLNCSYFTAVCRGRVLGLRNNSNIPLAISYINHGFETCNMVQDNGRTNVVLEANQSIYIIGPIWISIPQMTLCLATDFVLPPLMPNQKVVYGSYADHFELPSQVPNRPMPPLLSELRCAPAPRWDFLGFATDKKLSEQGGSCADYQDDWSLDIEEKKSPFDIFSCFDSTNICSFALQEFIERACHFVQTEPTGSQFDSGHRCLILFALLRYLGLINDWGLENLCSDLAHGQVPSEMQKFLSIMNIFTGRTAPPRPQAWLDFWAHCLDNCLWELIPFVNASFTANWLSRRTWFCRQHIHTDCEIEGPLAKFKVPLVPLSEEILLEKLG